MLDYEFRVDYEDETSEVVTVLGENSIGDAERIIRRDPEVVATTLLASIDREPHLPLGLV